MRPRLLPLAAAVLTAALGISLACRPKTEVPQWMASLPPTSQMAFSSELGWALEHKELQNALSGSKQVEQMLDLFLQKAHINPANETGRVTLYMMDLPTKAASASDVKGSFLLYLSGFRHPKALQNALSESFPPEGFLKARGGEWPLYVIMDVESGGIKLHLRAASDPLGGIWLGDLSALQALSQPMTAPEGLISAASWLTPGQKLQGALRPKRLLEDLHNQMPSEWVKDLPSDIDALLWGVTPGQDGKPWELDILVGGSPEAITQVTPWLQRFGAALDATRPAGQAPAQLLQERTRAGLRTTLDQAQLEAAMQRLGMPSFKLPKGPAK